MYPYDTRFFEESDGIIHSTSHHYEGGALEGWREWLKDKPIYALGPISPPPTLEEVKAEVASNPISSEVEEFLNRAHDTHGPNSVLYVRILIQTLKHLAIKCQLIYSTRRCHLALYGGLKNLKRFGQWLIP